MELARARAGARILFKKFFFNTINLKLPIVWIR